MLHLVSLCCLFCSFLRLQVNSIQLFRWMYFFSLGPVLWVTVNFATNKLFAFVEWMYYLEALYALDSVRRNARSLVFSCLLLPWFYACFWVIGCNQAAPCTDQQPFRQVGLPLYLQHSRYNQAGASEYAMSLVGLVAEYGFQRRGCSVLVAILALK